MERKDVEVGKEMTIQEGGHVLRLYCHKDIGNTIDTYTKENFIKEEGGLVNSECDAFSNESERSENKCSNKNYKRKTKETNKNMKNVLKKNKLQTSVQIKDFKCDNCTTSYESTFALMKHKKREHGIWFKCAICFLEFSEGIAYKHHKKRNHPSFVCNFCGEATFTKNQLNNHIEMKHLDDIQCPNCDMVFKTRSCLKNHIDRRHTIKEFKMCTICDYKTDSKSYMKNHFKRRHTDDTKKACQYCGLVVKGLNQHLRLSKCGKEVKGKKWSCSQCENFFTLKSSLLNHIKIKHERIRDKHCPECNYATYSGFNLKLHAAKIHLGKKMEKEACPHCDKVTTNLDYHMNIMHNLHFMTSTSQTYE